MIQVLLEKRSSLGLFEECKGGSYENSSRGNGI